MNNEELKGYSMIGKGQLTLKEALELPVISQGHFDNVIQETSEFRVLISRMTVADGMPYDNQISVLQLVDGSWQTVELYNPRTTKYPYEV